MLALNGRRQFANDTNYNAAADDMMMMMTMMMM